MEPTRHQIIMIVDVSFILIECYFDSLIIIELCDVMVVSCNELECSVLHRNNCTQYGIGDTCGDCTTGYAGTSGPSNTNDCICKIYKQPHICWLMLTVNNR
jgi:hypothetical protein